MSLSPNNLICIRANTTDAWTDITALVAMDGFSIGAEELVDDSSGRTLDGTMHNNVVTTKEFYDIAFMDLTPSQMASVMAVVKGRNKIYVKYPSIYSSTATLVSKQFYVQGRAAKMRFVHRSDGNVDVRWVGLAFRIAEI